MLFQSDKGAIKLARVRLGKTTLEVPVASFPGQVKGKSIVITGGMDGDEYAGMAAAYELINYFAAHPPKDQIMIIPVVNRSGFEIGMSQNPLDMQYPKHSYPGKPQGSPTERLVFWLSQFVGQADLWIDLHSGALTETLAPFVWTWQTKNPIVNDRVLQLVRALPRSVVIYQNHGSESGKTDRLGRHATAYVLLESGERGTVETAAVARHVGWVKKIITAFTSKPANSSLQCYRQVAYCTAPWSGVWQPQFNIAMTKGMVLGQLTSLDLSKTIRFAADHNGRLLWGKATMATNRGDILAAVAYDKQLLPPVV